ncbi:MAG: two-component system LytT family response regulator [Saprospiraceae bacterium]|jgi:two-component system LytT family response regulator|tara:strand:- start:619 stop:972 length:354 start_codon:yes stop_codon:yes gene_type:complete
MICATAPFQRLLVPTFQTLELINVSEIISVQAYENYSRLQLTQNRHYISTQSFGKFAAMLERHNFFQCHKSYVVNLDYVVRYHKAGEVEMSDKSKIAVARRRKDDFLEVLSQNVLVD